MNPRFAQYKKQLLLIVLIIGIIGVSSFTIFSGFIAQTKTLLGSKASENTGALSILTPAELEKVGLIDATRLPQEMLDLDFEPVKGDGQTDDTRNLQNIIDFAFRGVGYTVENNYQVRARNGRYAVILPADDEDAATDFKGEYLVSDTIHLFQNTVRDQRKGERANILIGSTQSRSNKKPKIILKADASKLQRGLGSTAPLGQSPDVRPVILITSNAGTIDQGGCGTFCSVLKTGDNFEQKIKNIHIVVETGNPTAVGLNFAGAQHSAIEDLVIEMKSGFAGIDGLPGVSSIATNIEVMGGKYGYYGVDNDNNGYPRGQHKVLALTNIKFINQTDAAIYRP